MQGLSGRNVDLRLPLAPAQHRTEQRAHARHQRVQRKWLSHHIHPRHAAHVRQGGPGKAGDQQHRKVRPALARRVGKLPSVQARQPDIGQQEIDPRCPI